MTKPARIATLVFIFAALLFMLGSVGAQNVGSYYLDRYTGDIFAEDEVTPAASTIMGFTGAPPTGRATKFGLGPGLYISGGNLVISGLAISQVTGLQAALDAAGGLPSMVGNGGKYLTNNGTLASWADLVFSFDDLHDLPATFTPSAHAAAHAAAGADPLTLTIAQTTGLQAALDSKALAADLTSHTGNTSNPHSVTKTQVGLGNADNTSDLAKPISMATQTALDAKAAAADLTSHTGNTSNPHSVTKTQVGLGNADNTSDLAKPISTATQTALNGKQATGNYVTALTGDVTASGPGSASATLANTAVTPGSYVFSNITVDAKGRITSASHGDLSGFMDKGVYDPQAAGYITGATGVNAAVGGWLILEGGPGLGASGGSVYTFGGSSTSATGGGVFTYGGEFPGGELNTSNGGGGLNTASGYLQLGVLGSRFTLQSGASSDWKLITPSAVGSVGQVQRIASVAGSDVTAEWYTPASGGYTTVALTTTVTNNNAVANTMQDVTGLSFPVTSGVKYYFKFFIPFTTAATTTGSRWSINGPAATRLHYKSIYSTSATVDVTNYLGAYDLPAGSNSGSAPNGNVAIIEGSITPSADGTLIARHASEVSGSAVIAQPEGHVIFAIIP